MHPDSDSDYEICMYPFLLTFQAEFILKTLNQ